MIHKSIFSFAILFFAVFKMISCKPKEAYIEILEAPKDSLVVKDTVFYKFIFAGDVMGHIPQVQASKIENGFNYLPNYQFVKSYIQSADLAFANLEVTLAGKPYSGYPMFSSPDEVAVALKDAGFDVIFTANNHSADKNKKGIERTIDVLDSLQFNYTGTFKDSLEFEKLNPLFIELGELKFAFINATYGTNGMPVPLPNIVQSLDTNVLKQSFIKAKQHQSDYIIAYLHWGNEYERKVSVKQQNLAKFCANNGVDFIIGSHPHVLQPFEIIQSDNGKDVPVFYSLGNFISNQRDRYKDGGGLLELNFFKIENEFGLHSVRFTPTWTYKGRFEDKFQYYIVPVSLWENNTSYFGFSKTDSIKISQFANDSRKLLNNISEIKFYEQQ